VRREKKRFGRRRTGAVRRGPVASATRQARGSRAMRPMAG